MEPEKTEILRRAACLLFDMDGTIFLGDRLLPGAQEIVAFLRDSNIPYFFLTNNSSRSKLDYVDKLARLGLSVGAERIFTSGEATAYYLQKRKPGARLYVVGTPSLEEEFARFGFSLVEEEPDYAVLGFDTTLTYEKLVHLCNFVRAGKPYIATHPDINCPVEGGFIPDIGAMMALVETSTGRQPDVIVGKPYAPVVEAVSEKTGFAPEQIVMVGDRLYTDIALGKAGLRTVLVLSGETKREDLAESLIQPDLVVAHVGELLEILKTIFR